MQRVIAFIFLLALSPFLAVFFLVVRFSSKGPFIFRQKRIGKNFEPFTIYKIRTMVENAEKLKKKYRYLNEADGPVFKIRNDPRFTRIGKILAYTGLDEILQLVNIIKGEMTFVGPRPLPINEALKVPNKYSKRFQILPGITSLWVIRGSHFLTFKEWMESDLEYLKVKSLPLDFYIFIITVLSIIKWSAGTVFIAYYALIVVFYGLFPDSIWWFQIFTFFSIFLFLGLNNNRKISLTLILLSLMLLISTMLSINTITSVPYFFSYILIFIIASAFDENKKDVLLKSYVIGTLIMGMLSLFYSTSKLIWNVIPNYLMFIDKSTNLIIPYYGYAFYAIFLIATLPYVLEKYIQNKSGIWYVTIILYNFFLIATFSKLAILVGFLEIAVFSIIHYRNHKSAAAFKIIYPSIIAVLLGIVLTASLLNKNNWFTDKLMKPSIRSRLEYFVQNIDIIKNSSSEKILIGYGLDNFFELSNQYEKGPGQWTKSSHNFFMQFFIENGIIAFLLIIIFIIINFRTNYNRYSISEKIILIFLLIYSLGSIYDLNTLPILLLFFILLIKPPKEQPIVGTNYIGNKLFGISYGWMVFSVVTLAVSIFWIRYMFLYSLFSLGNKVTVNRIEIFPYDFAFWTALIDNNSQNTDSLVSINNLMNKYSQNNADIEKYLINKLFANKAFCETDLYSRKYLQHVPFDLDIQNILIQISGKCRRLENDNLSEYYSLIKKNYEKPGANTAEMQGFFQYIASYYFANNKFQEFQDWFNKSWLIQIDNTTDKWSGNSYFNSGQALNITEPFEITLLFKNTNGLSGINLYGISDAATNYSSKLFIGTAENGKLLHIDISSGSSSDSITLYDAEINANDRLLKFAFNEDGSVIKISGYSGNIISVIDVNKITMNKYAKGVFPDAKLYLGYGLAPKSKLIIRKFMIKPI